LIEVVTHLLTLAITHLTQHCKRTWKSKLITAAHRSPMVAINCIKALTTPFIGKENFIVEHT